MCRIIGPIFDLHSQSVIKNNCVRLINVFNISHNSDAQPVFDFRQEQSDISVVYDVQIGSDTCPVSNGYGE